MNKDTPKLELGALKLPQTEKESEAWVLLEKAAVTIQRLQSQLDLREQTIQVLQTAQKEWVRETKR